MKKTFEGWEKALPISSPLVQALSEAFLYEIIPILEVWELKHFRKGLQRKEAYVEGFEVRVSFPVVGAVFPFARDGLDFPFSLQQVEHSLAVEMISMSQLETMCFKLVSTSRRFCFSEHSKTRCVGVNSAIYSNTGCELTVMADVTVNLKMVFSSTLE